MDSVLPLFTALYPVSWLKISVGVVGDANR